MARVQSKYIYVKKSHSTHLFCMTLPSFMLPSPFLYKRDSMFNEDLAAMLKDCNRCVLRTTSCLFLVLWIILVPRVSNKWRLAKYYSTTQIYWISRAQVVKFSNHTCLGSVTFMQTRPSWMNGFSENKSSIRLNIGSFQLDCTGLILR